jgi:hypothetical protein
MCVYPYDDNGILDLRLLPLPSLPPLSLLLDAHYRAIDIALTIEDTLDVEYSYSLPEQDLTLIADLHDSHAIYKQRAIRAAATMLAIGYLN